MFFSKKILEIYFDHLTEYNWRPNDNVFVFQEADEDFINLSKKKWQTSFESYQPTNLVTLGTTNLTTFDTKVIFEVWISILKYNNMR